MFSKVFSFGCSYSCWRQGFEFGFADIVANHFNSPLINLSQPGNSNDEIIFEFNKKFFSNEISNSLILFQTTHLTRNSYWDTKLNNIVSIQLAKRIWNNEEIQFIGSNDTLKTFDSSFVFNMHEFYMDYYLNVHNDEFEFYKLFNYLNHINQSVKNLNNQIVFLHFDSFVLDILLLKNINLFRPDGETSSYNWARKNKYTYSEEDYHLSENGNKVYAEKLIEFINTDQSKE